MVGLPEVSVEGAVQVRCLLGLVFPSKQVDDLQGFRSCTPHFLTSGPTLKP